MEEQKHSPILLGGIDNNFTAHTKRVCIFADNYDFDSIWIEKSEIVVFLQMEPKQSNRVHEIIPYKHLFDIILTQQPEIIEQCDNAIAFPYGAQMISKEDEKIYEKCKLFSIIASTKKEHPGHRLRHEVISLGNPNLTAYGPEYIDIGYGESGMDLGAKIIAGKDYAFQVIIENESWENYFTEKLIDCFKTGSIPIYRGCTNIETYFDTNGMFIVDTLDDIKHLLETLTMDDYNSKLEYVHKNFELSNQYSNIWSRVDKIIDNYISKL